MQLQSSHLSHQNYKIYSAEPILLENGRFIHPSEILIGVKRNYEQGKPRCITTIYCKDQADMVKVDEIADFYEHRKWFF